ncbi:MAG: cytochrome c oxidase subunit 3 [Alphaproteobacteria bacterium]|nr:cytochrome c oxidase subunit 3 [Alphaproteobacteria bacterium]
MAHGAEVKHDYHLVNPSPWPFVGSFFVFVLALGGVAAMRGVVPAPDEGAAGFGALVTRTFLDHGSLPLLFIGAAGVLFTMFAWWSDVIRESRAGDHTPVVDIGLRYGMILFIASEVMFFVAWFWMYFELAIFHGVRADWYVPTWDAATAAAWGSWPPPHVETFDPFHLPLMNTLILLLSGTTVTWAHHALQKGDRDGAKLGLLLTVLLGCLFTYVQFGIEYPEAGFRFGNTGETTTANIYGASFFMATGFHGAHVIIGTIFLAVCLIRLLAGHFTPTKHFGLEAAAWYWHFVDVVWLFLFAFVYVTPYLVLQS